VSINSKEVHSLAKRSRFIHKSQERPPLPTKVAMGGSASQGLGCEIKTSGNWNGFRANLKNAVADAKYIFTMIDEVTIQRRNRSEEVT
jgi:hypothetical protein